MEKLFGGLDLSKLLDPEKIISSMLPLEITVKIRVFKVKGKNSYGMEIEKIDLAQLQKDADKLREIETRRPDTL